MSKESEPIQISKASVARMEQVRIPTERRIRFGIKKYEGRIKDLEHRIDEAKNPEDRKNLDRQLEIAYVEQDIFLWEHDTTGAKKEALFGSTLRRKMELLGARENDRGEVEVESIENLRQTHICTVNMGELDRVNKEGGHALGDEVLHMAFQRIEAQIKEVYTRASKAKGETLKEEDLYTQYEVFRIGSNDFSIMLKNADAELADQVVERLSGSMPLPEKYQLDPVPFASSRVSLEESYEVLKNAQDHKEQEGVTENTRGMTEWIGIVRNQSQVMNDFEKVRSRLNRIAKKIKKDDNKAKSLYDQFLKKTLGRLFVDSAEENAQTFEEFKKTITERGAFDAEKQLEWQENIFKTAEKEAMDLLKTSAAERIKSESELQKKVLEEFKSHADDIGLETELSRETKKEPEPQLLTESSETKTFEKRTAFLGETSGERVLEEKQKALEEAKRSGNSMEIRLRELELQLERLRRDTLTGLPGRGMYYQETEEALQIGRPISVLSIDMAFLKYFDREGGKKTGDLAIKTAGRILEKVREQYADWDVRVYRVGGDEFAKTMAGTDETRMKKVIQTLRSLSEQVGPIPSLGGGTIRYVPEALQFNIGVSHRTMNDIRPITQSEAQKESDRITHEADVRVKVDKQVNRMIFLLKKLTELEPMDPADRARMRAGKESLLTYSEKAIFGEAGRERLLQWAEAYQEGDLNAAQLQEELVQFIVTQSEAEQEQDIKAESIRRAVLESEMKEIFGAMRARGDSRLPSK